ncbi:MAG: hypothetical protein HC769_36690 [Cyanobacteria bacterium CRU_2_1]|nr:hypothetical protein [Cyanobacteria bacterium CRU_2_1]
MLDSAFRRSPPQHLSQPLLPTTTAIVLNLSLKTENISGLLMGAENLKGLHPVLGGDRSPTDTLQTTVRKARTLGDRPLTPSGTLNVYSYRC